MYNLTWVQDVINKQAITLFEHNSVICALLKKQLDLILSDWNG